jgi:hypothetical protein
VRFEGEKDEQGVGLGLTKSSEGVEELCESLEFLEASENFWLELEASEDFLLESEASEDFLLESEASENFLLESEASEDFLLESKASEDFLLASTTIKSFKEPANHWSASQQRPHIAFPAQSI